MQTKNTDQTASVGQNVRKVQWQYHKHGENSVIFANRTQAQNKANQLGEGWSVHQSPQSRRFYVRRETAKVAPESDTNYCPQCGVIADQHMWGTFDECKWGKAQSPAKLEAKQEGKPESDAWSICPDCGGYSDSGHQGTPRCRNYKPQGKPELPQSDSDLYANAYIDTRGKLREMEKHAEALAEALRDTGHDLSEIALWIKCPESKPEAKLASIATLIGHNQNKRRNALTNWEGVKS